MSGRLSVGLAVGGAGLVFAMGLVLWGGPLAGGASAVVDWLRALGPTGWGVFFGLQVLVAMSGVFPASALGVAAGIVYGVPLGFALAASSTLVGAIAAFALSRSVFRPAIERLVGRTPRLVRLDQAVASEGWRLVCLLRASPVMPFAVTSYAFGLSSCGVRAYVIGTLAAMPALLGYVAIGSLAGAGAFAWHSGAGVVKLALLGVGALATVLATWRIGRLVSRSVSAGVLAPLARS